MGKPYQRELSMLASTYDWSMKADVSGLAAALADAISLPLVAVGSGGSLTVANFAAFLHERYAGQTAKASTPLELADTLGNVRGRTILFASSGGRNPDILGSLRLAISSEPAHLIVLCTSPHSPLTELAREFEFIDLIELEPPAGKDGFLATNSILALTVLLSRAYAMATSICTNLPQDFEGLFPGSAASSFVADLISQCTPLWTREVLSVLFGPSVSTAAIDIESKFTEAALGSVQIADFRNFAHGRHHWLAKRGMATAVLALVADADRDLGNRTLRLIPAEIPVVQIDIPFTGLHASIFAIVVALYLTGIAGDAKGIDPGQPGVPIFGRQLYHLQAFTSSARGAIRSQDAESVAIRRKAKTAIDILVARDEYNEWQRAYTQFTQKLSDARIGALVFDYDGTLCGGPNRYSGIGGDVALQLENILSHNIKIGIASGRGRSIRTDLRSKLPPTLWSQIVMGYYNGAEIGLLSDPEEPKTSEAPCDALAGIAELLRSDPQLARIANCTIRSKQVTLEAINASKASMLWELSHRLVQSIGPNNIAVVQSSHSVDVLAPGVTKCAVVQEMQALVAGSVTDGEVLCIGDRGAWPGNDHALLSEPLSLSSDDVSNDPATCWNLAHLGYRNVQATIGYLTALHLHKGYAHIDLARLR